MRIPTILLLLVVSLNCTGCYLLKQGYYLASYRCHARSITTVLKKTTDPNVRSFLSLARDIKSFAVDSLGLADNRNYSVYASVDRDYLVNVVTAAAVDTFRQFQWRYPIVGSVPYKGFFDPEGARSLVGELKTRGLDVYTWKADGFSSLGIIADPLYSFMQRYSPYELASLIIHEQTHATLYLKSQAQFNEEFASFVGDEGALRFIADRYGDTSRAYHDALLFQEDYRTYREFLTSLYSELATVYQNRALSREEKLREKSRIIAQRKHDFTATYDQRFTTKRFRNLGNVDINNAYLCAHMTYAQDLLLYYRIYDLHRRDLRATVAEMLKVRKSKLPPREYLQRLAGGE